MDPLSRAVSSASYDKNDNLLAATDRKRQSGTYANVALSATLGTLT